MSQGSLIVLVGLDVGEVLAIANLVNTLEGISFFDFRIVLLSLFCFEMQFILGLLMTIFGVPLVLLLQSGCLSSAGERDIFGW
jgi:hypothetical protein